MNRRGRWTNLCRALGSTGNVASSYRQIVDLYQTPPRSYHNLRHVDHCLHEFDAVRNLATNPVAIEAAIWFHDAIYDSRVLDNEDKSASAADAAMAAMGVGARLRKTVQKLILYTKHNGRPATIDGRIIVDVDLASLASSMAVFVKTAWRIRKEYSWVPESVFWPKRAEFLQTLLKRKQIFLTDYFFQKYEAKARKNMSGFILLIERGMHKNARS